MATEQELVGARLGPLRTTHSHHIAAVRKPMSGASATAGFLGITDLVSAGSTVLDEFGVVGTAHTGAPRRGTEEGKAVAPAGALRYEAVGRKIGTRYEAKESAVARMLAEGRGVSRTVAILPSNQW